jgi:uncharacterized protein (DUF58 family)
MLTDRRPLITVMAILVPAALLAAGKFPYMFLYLTTLAVLIPYGRLRRSLRNLRGEISVSSRTREVGQSFEVNYRIINSESGTFPYLELANATDSFKHESPYIFLKPGAIKEIRREISCRRRGVYDLKSLTVRTGDPFGLFQIEKPLADGGEVKVYPRLRYFPGITLPTHQHVGDRTSKNAAYESHTELTRLREWQDGDSMKRIHWKQSAKQGKIIVKNYEHSADAEFTLFIDMHQESYQHDENHQLEDLAVELAASLVYHRLRENLSIILFSDPSQEAALKGKRLRDYEQILDHMIALAPQQAGSFFSYLRRQSYFLLPNTSLYLITPSLTLADADLLLSVKRKGFSVVLFYLCLNDVPADIDTILSRMREAGIKVHVLYTSKGDTHNDSKF